MHSEQAYFQRLKKLFYENPKQFMRTFLLIFLPLALIIIAVNMSFYSLITKSRASEAAIEENHVIKLGEMMIYSELKTLEKDMFNLAYHVEQTRFLSESPGVSKALILKATSNNQLFY